MSRECQVRGVDRRAFLAAGLGLGASGVLAGSARALAAGTGTEKRAISKSRFAERVAGHAFTLSCAGYSFREYFAGKRQPVLTLERFIDFCAEQELDGVELTSYYFKRTDRRYLAELRRRAFLNGLTITGTPVGNNFCLPPGEKRDQQIAHVKSWIENASLLGAPCMRIFAGNAPAGSTEDEARAWAVECLAEVSDHAAEHGVVLALENHGGITSTADQLIRLLEQARSPWLAINLDTGNFKADGYAEIARAAPYAVVVQHKVELRVHGGKKEAADLDRILEILRGAGFRGVVALEYEASDDPMEAVPKHLAELKRLARG